MGLFRTVGIGHYWLYPHQEGADSRYSVVRGGMSIYCPISRPCERNPSVLVARLHSLVRRSVHLRLSAMGPKTVIQWGRRLLYVILFISLLVAYGNWDKPTTYTFLGSVLCIIMPLLFFLQDDKWEDEEASMVIE